MESKKDVMHTPEPWGFTDHGVGEVCVYAENDQNCIASLDADDSYSWGGKTVCEHMANARRIVACVNACKGIGTETLERYHEDHKPDNGFGLHREAGLIAQRDELLALTIESASWLREIVDCEEEADLLERLDSAIAKCEEKS